MSKKSIKSVKNIEIIGQKLHNLKNISLNIPKDNLVVISGVSGSGKSSLAFDTLYAEGQKRYIESLSSCKTILGKITKTRCWFINGIAPTAYRTKSNFQEPKIYSGYTVTEIYDYLKLLYARIGKTYSPISGKGSKKTSNIRCC